MDTSHVPCGNHEPEQTTQCRYCCFRELHNGYTISLSSNPRLLPVVEVHSHCSARSQLGVWGVGSFIQQDTLADALLHS
eukprot:854736-Amphidinium_carterae.1